jgi:hypothetical protein
VCALPGSGFESQQDQNFPLSVVHTPSGAHPASYTVGYRGEDFFPSVKGPECEADRSLPTTATPPIRLHGTQFSVAPSMSILQRAVTALHVLQEALSVHVLCLSASVFRVPCSLSLSSGL